MSGMRIAAATTLAVALVTGAGSAAGKRDLPVRDCATRAEADGPSGVHGKANLRIGPVVFFGLRHAATEPLEHVLQDKFGFDRLYDWAFYRPAVALARGGQ